MKNETQWFDMSMKKRMFLGSIIGSVLAFVCVLEIDNELISFALAVPCAMYALFIYMFGKELTHSRYRFVHEILFSIAMAYCFLEIGNGTINQNYQSSKVFN